MVTQSTWMSIFALQRVTSPVRREPPVHASRPQSPRSARFPSRVLRRASASVLLEGDKSGLSGAGGTDTAPFHVWAHRASVCSILTGGLYPASGHSSGSTARWVQATTAASALVCILFSEPCHHRLMICFSSVPPLWPIRVLRRPQHDGVRCGGHCHHPFGGLQVQPF